MIEFDKDFEKQCGEYMEYLYRLAEKQYNDCPDIDTLVQDTLTVLVVKVSKGENIEYRKGFLSAVLRNKYNAWLREKYKGEYVEYADGAISETYNEIEEKEESLPENNNDKILRLHKQGMSSVDIAKELGLGVGEVKLVINLFKGA